MIVCALIPRLALMSALGERRELIGRSVALAPEPGGPQVVGECSGAAEAFGIRTGMRVAEALSRCPALVLVPPDPVRAEAAWEDSLRRLEAIGAAVEPARPGEAFFAAEPLHAIHGGVEAVLARARRVLRPPARLGAGPNRLCARAAAARMRARRPAQIVSGEPAQRLLAGLPVAALCDRLGNEWEGAQVPDTLERLGVATLGELAALPAAAVADRFGSPGIQALRLARGVDGPLRPRRPHEELVERLGLGEAISGRQLERALGLLIERLLANPRRGGRTIRRLGLEARLTAGGGWRSEIALRRASADSERLRLAICPRLAQLPGPISVLGLRAFELGPEAGDQASLTSTPADERRGRLGEAVRQARAAGGRDAVLRVLEVDPRSRVPERRMLLAPFGETDPATQQPGSRQ